MSTKSLAASSRRRAKPGEVDDLVATSDSTLARAKELATNVGQAAVETAREGYERVSDQARETYERADELVQHNPETSMAVLLGLGFISGLAIGAMFRSSSCY
jgi:ElaB/YqjD/DUF883 family membrane-anchored ribosome-binding protein